MPQFSKLNLKLQTCLLGPQSSQIHLVASFTLGICVILVLANLLFMLASFNIRFRSILESSFIHISIVTYFLSHLPMPDRWFIVTIKVSLFFEAFILRMIKLGSCVCTFYLNSHFCLLIVLLLLNLIFYMLLIKLFELGYWLLKITAVLFAFIMTLLFC